jgi:hypothetical protein
LSSPFVLDGKNFLDFFILHPSSSLASHHRRFTRHTPTPTPIARRGASSNPALRSSANSPRQPLFPAHPSLSSARRPPPLPTYPAQRICPDLARGEKGGRRQGEVGGEYVPEKRTPADSGTLGKVSNTPSGCTSKVTQRPSSRPRSGDEPNNWSLPRESSGHAATGLVSGTLRHTLLSHPQKGWGARLRRRRPTKEIQAPSLSLQLSWPLDPPSVAPAPSRRRPDACPPRHGDPAGRGLGQSSSPAAWAANITHCQTLLGPVPFLTTAFFQGPEYVPGRTPRKARQGNNRRRGMSLAEPEGWSERETRREELQN